MAALVHEIEEEGVQARDGDPVAGVEKILRQNPFQPPTRRPKRSPKPLFHFKTREAREELWDEVKEFLTLYMEASDALRSGRRASPETRPIAALGGNPLILK